MAKIYDVIIIGTGSAGTQVAYDCRAADMSVAIIDSRRFGGTCALRGCVPKKVYTAAAEAMDWADRMEGLGIEKNDFRLNWPDLQEFKRTFTEPFPENREQGYLEAGIDTYHGEARFADERIVQVDGTTLQGTYIIVATGAKPRPLDVPGEKYLMSSTEILDLERLPKDILFVGAGFISMEFAHVAVRAGSNVRIIQRSNRPLKPFDPDLVGILVKASEHEGITFNFNTELLKVEKRDQRYNVFCSSNGATVDFDADLVVHGAGRIPQIDALDLANANVRHTQAGIDVNDYLQSTSNPRVYAAGDAAESGPPLTPVASMDGEVVAENIINGNHRMPNYTVIPSIVFTEPNLTSVGLSEAVAGELNLNFRVNYAETGNWVTSRRINQPYSGYKVLIEKETERIIGAHLLGPHAGEVINIFALAMKSDTPATTLKRMIYAYPTSASDIKYMLD